MLTWKIGNVRVTRLQELAVTTGRPSALPQFTRDQAKREGEWILPFVDEAGRLLLSIHAWLVESEGRKILVDTCVGNHKQRSRFKEFDNLDLPFSPRSPRPAPRRRRSMSCSARICTSIMSAGTLRWSIGAGCRPFPSRAI